MQNKQILHIPPLLKRVFPFVIIAGLVVICYLGFHYSTKRLSDFAGYYIASTIITSGSPGSSLYNDSAFINAGKHLGIDEPSIVYYVNPPMVSLITVPFTPLNPFTAKLLWNIFSVGLILLCWHFGKKHLTPQSTTGNSTLLFALLMCTIPFLRNLQRGQMYVMLLGLVLLLWVGYSKEKPWLTGVSLALLLLLKYFGWMFFIFFIVEKRRKELRAALLFFLVGLLLNVAFFGIETYREHIQRLFASFHTMDAALTGLPCVPALFGSLFVEHSEWNQYPLINLPILAPLCTFVLLGVTLFFTFQRQKNSRLRFFAIIVLAVLFTPLAADHHYILLALPLYVLLSFTDGKTGKVWKVFSLFLLAYLLLGWLPAFHLNEFGGVGKLLLFPRLYAASGVWFLLVFGLKDR